jgi:hypothetical protein
VAAGGEDETISSLMVRKVAALVKEERKRSKAKQSAKTEAELSEAREAKLTHDEIEMGLRERVAGFKEKTKELTVTRSWRRVVHCCSSRQRKGQLARPVYWRLRSSGHSPCENGLFSVADRDREMPWLLCNLYSALQQICPAGHLLTETVVSWLSNTLSDDLNS